MTLLLSHRGRRRPFVTPPTKDAVIKCCSGYSVGKSNAAPRRPVWAASYIPLVNGLLQIGGPLTVSRMITAVVVNTLYCKSARIPGIRRPAMKSAEVMPLSTYLNAARPVVLKFSAVSLFAPRDHAFPYTIQRGSGLPMSGATLRPFLQSTRSARRCFTKTQVGTGRLGDVPTITAALPDSRSSWTVPHLPDNRQGSESLPRHTDKAFVFHNHHYNDTVGVWQ